MRGYTWSQTKKQEVTKLRKEDRLSVEEISAKTGIPKGTVCVWVRDIPLTVEERTKRRHARKKTEKKSFGQESKFYSSVNTKNLSRSQKGRIAEAAILFRLALHNFPVFSSEFDGESLDWIVDVSGKLVRLEVRWAMPEKGGLSSIRLTKSSGRHASRKITSNDADYIIGYDLYSDTAFVFSIEETKNNKARISIREDAAERWDKLRG
jgi:transposase-like protein